MWFDWIELSKAVVESSLAQNQSHDNLDINSHD
jgi:hypothetical protein